MADLFSGLFGTVLIVSLGVLPGFPGEKLYSRIMGRSWLEKDFEYVIRVLAFSVGGLLCYSLIATAGLPTPDHVLPRTYQEQNLTSDALPRLALGYIGHALGSTLLGLLSGGFHLRIRRWLPATTAHPDAWDNFVQSYAQSRWILVTLRNGESYAGMLQQADISREPDYRDIVLCEPAKYDPSQENYQATSLQYLYLTGEQIASIAAVTDLNKDVRLTKINEFIFEREEEHERRETAAQESGDEQREPTAGQADTKA